MADALGLGRPEPDEVDERLPLDLYRHCRDVTDRTLFETGYFGSRQAGWIDLRAHKTESILTRLLPDDTRPGRDSMKHRLESISWNSLLGISRPDLICEVRFHGRQIAVRFRSHGPRGQWLLNEQLPPAES